MPLSCYCDGDFEEFYEPPEDLSVFVGTRRKRCSSCLKLISIGADVAKFSRWRPPNGYVEERIYGDDGEVPLAPLYHCEECAGLYFALHDLGFVCITLDENMRDLVAEYSREYMGRRK